MCLSPVNVGTSQAPEIVACRNCKRCRNNRLNDWVGRCIAEKHVSDRVYALTLTYGTEYNERSESVYLTYKHIQDLLKRLRQWQRRQAKRRGIDPSSCSVRYIVAGEYGSKRGRAHWHMCVFFRGITPEVPQEEVQQQMWSFWPHGYTYMQNPDVYGFRYVLKYVLKDDTQKTHTNRLMMSKYPPLGAEYLCKRAVDMADQALSLNSWEYTFPEARYKNGTPVRFYIQGRTRELVLERYLRRWRARQRQPVQLTETVTKAIIDMAKSELWFMESDYDEEASLTEDGFFMEAPVRKAIALENGDVVTSDIYGLCRVERKVQGNLIWHEEIATKAELRRLLRQQSFTTEGRSYKERQRKRYEEPTYKLFARSRSVEPSVLSAPRSVSSKISRRVPGKS